MNRFPLPLQLETVGYNQWKLISPFEYIAKDNTLYQVGVGFITDMASIPRIPLVWTIIGSPAVGRYRESAVVHDYLYDVQITTRKKADDLFLEAMKYLKVPFWKRWLMYLAVRAGAYFIWKRHKRELENLPD